MFPGVKLLLPASNQIVMEIPKFSVPPELLGFPHRGILIRKRCKSIRAHAVPSAHLPLILSETHDD